jgi:hypothetical protein
MKKVIILLFVFTISLISEEYTFYVRKIDWHTGIVIKNDSLAREIILVINKFPKKKYLEFGMGDEYYYQAQNPSYFDAVKAAAVSSPAAIRIHAKSIQPEKLAGYSDFMYKINVSKEKYIKILKYLDSSIQKETEENDIVLSTKHDRSILFMKSTVNYHLFNTCNTWIAKGLLYAGIIDKSRTVIQAKDLEKKLKNIGTPIDK